MPNMHEELVQRVYGRFLSAGAPFQPGDAVKVKHNYAHAPFRGDTGTIEKYIPFGKYYVQLEKNGRQIVAQEGLEKA